MSLWIKASAKLMIHFTYYPKAFQMLTFISPNETMQIYVLISKIKIKTDINDYCACVTVSDYVSGILLILFCPSRHHLFVMLLWTHSTIAEVVFWCCGWPEDRFPAHVWCCEYVDGTSIPRLDPWLGTFVM